MAETNPELFRGIRAQWSVVLNQALQYGVALLSVALALGTTLLFSPYLDPTLTPPFFAAVMVSAWYGGLGPGLLATALSTLVINYLLVEHVFLLSVPNLGSLARLSVFVMAAILINSLSQSQRVAQRRAEANLQSLRESETRFSWLADSNVIGILVADLNGSILEANDTFLQMVGYTQEELRSGRLHWRNMTSPEFVEANESAVQELKATGACAPFEKEYIRKDGTRVPVLQGAAMTGATTLIGFALDLSERKRGEAERKQTEEALRQSETRFQVLVSNMPGMVYRYQPCKHHSAQTFTYISSGSRDLIELEPEAILQDANAFLSLIHPDDRPSFESSVAIAVEASSNWQWEGRLITPSGKLKWIQGRSRPQSISDGMVWDGLLFDITARKQTEESLQQSEERLRLALDAGQMGAWEWNLETDVQRWDVNQYKLFGIDESRSQLSTDTFFNFIHPDDRALAQQLTQRVLEQGGSFCTEFRIVRPDGSTRWLSSQGMVVQGYDNKPIRLIGVNFDITDRKQAEVEREQLLAREQAAREQAEAANRTKDEFLAVLSHELRSPLNPILGWAKLLRRGKLDEQKTAHALETIERNASLQTQLIGDLLDVSRILQGKLSLNIAPVNLATTIAAAMETVRLAAEAKSIQMQTMFDEDIGQVAGDSSRLQQIIWNLLSNAVKFTPEGGQIQIRLESVGSQAQITVRDTGKGISPDFLPHVFDYFRQADSAITRKFGGLGLGLAIVRHLTELHGGSVAAASLGEGQGSTFTVRLPLMKRGGDLGDRPQADGGTDVPPPSLTGLQILLVDDDADTRDYTSFVLQQAGATVTLAASASEALQLFMQSPPDLLLSDVGMPEMDGYTLIRQVRAMPPEQGGDIPAIALTAYAGELNQQQAIAAGFQQHLAKPISPETLIQSIRQLVCAT